MIDAPNEYFQCKCACATTQSATELKNSAAEDKIVCGWTDAVSHANFFIFVPKHADGRILVESIPVFVKSSFCHFLFKDKCKR